MRVHRRRSRKQSAASSGSQRKDSLVYFVDECLGQHLVADALRNAGAHVEVHHQHFPPGAPDADWLPVVGQRRWIVLTKDRHIRRRELEISAIIHARVRAFVLTAADLTGAEQAAIFVRALGYEAYLKDDLVPVMRKGNVAAFRVSRTIFGGNGNEYHTLQYMDSFEEIGKGPMPTRVLGPVGGPQLAAKAFPHVAGVTRQILRYVPELSFQASERRSSQ